MFITYLLYKNMCIFKISRYMRCNMIFIYLNLNIYTTIMLLYKNNNKIKYCLNHTYE